MDESVIIPKGVKDNTLIRFERKVFFNLIKGHSSENKDLVNGDLVITVKVQNDKIYRRENDDLVSDFEVSIAEAIFGGKIEYSNFDGTLKRIDINPGTQANDKILFKNFV